MEERNIQFDNFLKLIMDENNNVKDLYEMISATQETADQELARRLLQSKTTKTTYDEILKECKKRNNYNLKDLLSDEYNLIYNKLSYPYDYTLMKERLDILKEQEERIMDEIVLMNDISRREEEQKNTSYQHLARFKKSKSTDLWVPLKTLNNYTTEEQIDIIQRGDYYIYSIQEQDKKSLILASCLFLDFNKQTNYNGQKIESETRKASTTTIGNLTGYFCEYEKENSNKLKRKTEYFQNSGRNDYQSTNGLPLVIRSISYEQIFLLTDVTVTRKNNYHQIAGTTYTDYIDYILTGEKIPDDIQSKILKDVEHTNPEDLQVMRRFFENPINLPKNKVYTKK